jgi:hypothetical protein
MLLILFDPFTSRLIPSFVFEKRIKNLKRFEFLGFHGGVDEQSFLLGCDAASVTCI